MKKLLMASIVLSFFAISLALVQISCSKTTASPTSPTAQINKIVYGQYGGSDYGYYVANYDGTGQTRVNITLPSGFVSSNQHHPVLSPDGLKLFFVAYDLNNQNARSIFTCNINWSSLLKIIDCPNATEIQIGGAY